MPRKPDLSKVKLDVEGNVVEKWCRDHNDGRGAWLPAEIFRPRAAGLANVCRACESKAALARARRNVEGARAARERYKKRHPEKVKEWWRAQAARRKAERQTKNETATT